ncbi:hypothetical protein CBM2586_A80095 [Cupriavidus phytorum]|uniref:Uncharacterized protein n=1 Tax=Cupriavidus taiwanensis TaxID=164546 RepID=A0A975XBE0_9BURK|nr:hypothetical protein CBM2586_A80095 [Cupriavidus taiwanensis]
MIRPAAFLLPCFPKTPAPGRPTTPSRQTAPPCLRPPPLLPILKALRTRAASVRSCAARAGRRPGSNAPSTRSGRA